MESEFNFWTWAKNFNEVLLIFAGLKLNLDLGWISKDKEKSEAIENKFIFHFMAVQINS